METTHQDVHDSRQRWGLTGAIVAAITASLCCVGPLLLLAVGVSGAWIGTLTALEPFRPLLAALALGFLGFAFYRVYRKPAAEACEPGSSCANPRSDRINTAVLWIVTVGILGLLAFPYAAPHLVASAPVQKSSDTVQVVLAVQNMTCGSCPVTVAGSITRLPGVVDAQATLEPPEVVVLYDPTQVSAEDLIAATTNAGYPSSVKQK